MTLRKRTVYSGALVLATSALAFFIYGCSTADTNDISGDHPGATSAAAVGGSTQGSDSGSTAYYDVKRSLKLIDVGNELFGIPEASAAACSVSNETCTAGVVTVAFAGCTSKNGRTTFTGGYTLTLGGPVGFLTCPISGFWLNFFKTANATLFKTYSDGTSISNVDGVSVTANNLTPVGWDSTITLTKNTTPNAYGSLRTNVNNSTVGGVTTANETLFQSGVQHVATGKKKGVSATLWDHTISMSGLGLKVVHTYDRNALAASVDTKVVNSADATSMVIVQHNLAKWTARNFFTDVTYKAGTDNYCGCYPVSGNIKTTNTGSKTTAEQLTFTYATTNVCGSYDIQACADNTCATLTGAVTSGVLNHCL